MSDALEFMFQGPLRRRKSAESALRVRSGMATQDNKHHNGTDKNENAGQGDGHQQIGNQQQPNGGAPYRDDSTEPHTPGSPGNEPNQGQGNKANEHDKGNDSK